MERAKTKIKNANAIIMVALSIIVFVGYKGFSQQSAWTAPSAANQKTNSVTADVTNNLAGKNLYVKECSTCHGKYGKGDGPAAVALGKPVGDLSSTKSQAQTDGSYFWKMQMGKPPMPAFQKRLNETQMWQLVNYMRTLKATSKTG